MTLPQIPAGEPHENPLHDTAIALWPDGAPGAKGDGATDVPTLSIHLPRRELSTGAAVIVNPGGGYHILAADHEGLQVARYLNRHGIAAFVLRYRLQPNYGIDTALADAERAIRTVRARATDFGIDANRVGMMGFSAGGHLASLAGTRSGEAEQADNDIDRHNAKPNFLALIYPATDASLFGRGGQFFPTTHADVDANTPPTFLLSTHEDLMVVPEHSLRYYQALQQHGVAAELHVFGFGTHGTGLAPGDPHLHRWTELLIEWLNQMGFLATNKRIAMSGDVTLNDAPVFWGWVTLLPDDRNRPTIAVYISQMSKGKFTLTQDNGPVPGRYRSQLHIVADHFDAPQDGAYSRNDALVLSHRSPDSTEDYVVDIDADTTTLSLSFYTQGSSEST